MTTRTQRIEVITRGERRRRKRCEADTLRRSARVCWTQGMDMPELPVIETQDTHKIGRKGLWRPGALRDGSVTRDRVETPR